MLKVGLGERRKMQMYSRLGLKGCLKDYKGMHIRYKIKEIIRELKYAWQRALRGYDDTEVWDIDFAIKNRLIALLQDYKESRDRFWSWCCPDGYDWSKVCKSDGLRYIFSSEQIDAIIDTFIFHLQMSDEDFVEKKLFGFNIYDKEYKAGSKTSKDYKIIEKIRKQNQDAAIKLLGLLMDQLWD